MVPELHNVSIAKAWEKRKEEAKKEAKKDTVEESDEEGEMKVSIAVQNICAHCFSVFLETSRDTFNNLRYSEVI